MSTIDRFRDNTVVAALAMGGDPAILAALAGGPHEGVRDAWGAADMDMSWDKGDPFGSALAALATVVDLLSAWESPEWGNVSGRYNSTGHTLTAEDWAALETGDFPNAGTIGTLDTPDPWQVQTLFDYLDESPAHLAAVVHLGDMLSQIIDRCHASGADY